MVADWRPEFAPRFRRFVLPWALVVGVMTPGRSFALDGEQGGVPPRPTVDIVLAGVDDVAEAALMTTLRRSLERLGPNINFKRVPRMSPGEVATAVASPSVAVTVWIDFGMANAATVYVSEGRNVFTRRFELGRALDSVALDLLDVVVTSSVETVLSGRSLGITRQEFTRSLAPLPPVTTQVPAQPAKSPSANESAMGFSAAVFYEGSLAAPTRPIDGPGLRIDGWWESLWFGLGFHGHRPYEISAPGVTVRLVTEGLRLSVGRIVPVRNELMLVVAFGVGADVTHVRSLSTQSDVAPASAFFATDFVARPFAGIERRFDRLTLGLTAGFDVNLVGAAYVVRTASGTRPVWTPWRLRPVLALTIGLAF